MYTIRNRICTGTGLPLSIRAETLLHRWEPAMEEITLKAMAKINLGLDVIRRREDGYHEVRMIMQTVNLYDELTFRKQPGDKVRLTANLRSLPTDGHNRRASQEGIRYQGRTVYPFEEKNTRCGRNGGGKHRRCGRFCGNE